MPVGYWCVLLSAAEEVEEKWVVVMSPVVRAAHPPHCRGQKKSLEGPMVRRAAKHSTSRLQPKNDHLGSAFAVNYDAVVE